MADRDENSLFHVLYSLEDLMRADARLAKEINDRDAIRKELAPKIATLRIQAGRAFRTLAPGTVVCSGGNAYWQLNPETHRVELLPAMEYASAIEMPSEAPSAAAILAMIDPAQDALDDAYVADTLNGYNPLAVECLQRHEDGTCTLAVEVGVA